MSLYWSNGLASLYHADAREIPLADESVHVVVTSPPYLGLRIYQGCDDRVLGLESTPELYLEHLMEVFGEVKRVLRDDGICWVNLGDSYAGSSKGQNGDGNHAAKHGEKQHTSKGTLTGGLPGYKDRFRNGMQYQNQGTASNGNLLNIPARFALAMQAEGWIHRDTVIWAKKSAMPESLAGWRWEQCRVKVDGTHWTPETFKDGKPDSTRDHGAFRAHLQAQWSPCPGCAKCELHGGLVLRKGSWRCTDSYETIMMFTKQMGYYADGEAVKQPLSAATIADGANKRNVWSDIKPEPFGGQHYATFPSDLPRLCIQASTSERGCCPVCGSQWARVVSKESHADNGRNPEAAYTHMGGQYARQLGGNYQKQLDESPTQTLGWRPTCSHPEASKPVPALVCDPFAGTGTSMLAATRLGRRSVGTDLSEDYLKMAVQRLEGQTLPLRLL